MIGNEAEQAMRDIMQSRANYIKNNKMLWDSCIKEVMCSDEHLTRGPLLYNEAQTGGETRLGAWTPRRLLH